MVMLLYCTCMSYHFNESMCIVPDSKVNAKRDDVQGDGFTCPADRVRGTAACQMSHFQDKCLFNLIKTGSCHSGHSKPRSVLIRLSVCSIYNESLVPTHLSA